MTFLGTLRMVWTDSQVILRDGFAQADRIERFSVESLGRSDERRERETRRKGATKVMSLSLESHLLYHIVLSVA